jgi:hypothetical protein
MESLSRRSVIAGAIGVVGAGVAGCAPATPAVTESASPTPSESVDTTPRWPLTGVPLKDGEDPKHIAVAAKAASTKADPKNAGLNKADIVFVQSDGYHDSKTGESETRLVPVFHTTYPEAEQPMRSMRPVDALILSPITGIIGSTGAAIWVQQYMASFKKYLVTNLSDINVPSDAYTYLPHVALFRATIVHPKRLAKLTKEFAGGPQQHYLPWAASDAEVSTANGQAATSITIPWMRKMTYEMKYEWDATKQCYLRSVPWGKHVLADGSRVTTDNVLVIKAEMVYGKISADGTVNTAVPAHVAEPIHKILNATGVFYYAHGGKYVTGKWSKGAANEVFKFTLDDGTPLKVAPGRTFIELPFAESKVVMKG